MQDWIILLLPDLTWMGANVILFLFVSFLLFLLYCSLFVLLPLFAFIGLSLFSLCNSTSFQFLVMEYPLTKKKGTIVQAKQLYLFNHKRKRVAQGDHIHAYTFTHKGRGEGINNCHTHSIHPSRIRQLIAISYSHNPKLFYNATPLILFLSI